MLIRLAVLAYCGLMTAHAIAQDQCKPIQFTRGASSTTVSGTASNSEAPATCYTITTGKGQTARVRLTRKGSDTAFTIPGVVDNREDYSFPTAARTYRIDVYRTLRATPPGPFTLQVSVR